MSTLLPFARVFAPALLVGLAACGDDRPSDIPDGGSTDANATIGWDGGAGVPCAATTCSTGTEACCYPSDGDAGPTCTPTSACAAPSFRVECDGHEDCAPGTYCCFGGNARVCRERSSCSNPACRTVNDCRPFFDGLVECSTEDPVPICVPIV